jgi:hypothetical protein
MLIVFWISWKCRKSTLFKIGLGVPVLDKNNEAAKEIKRLTNLDFPNSDLKINDFGEISLNN